MMSLQPWKWHLTYEGFMHGSPFSFFSANRLSFLLVNASSIPLEKKEARVETKTDPLCSFLLVLVKDTMRWEAENFNK